MIDLLHLAYITISSCQCKGPVTFRITYMYSVYCILSESWRTCQIEVDLQLACRCLALNFRQRLAISVLAVHADIVISQQHDYGNYHFQFCKLQTLAPNCTVCGIKGLLSFPLCHRVSMVKYCWLGVYLQHGCKPLPQPRKACSTFLSSALSG